MNRSVAVNTINSKPEQHSTFDTPNPGAGETSPPFERITFLGMGVDNVSFNEAAEWVFRMCRQDVPRYIYTPNVDHFIRIRRDAELKKFYQQADLSLADGMPIIWAAKILGCPLKEKVSGSDLFIELCKGAAERGVRVCFIGAGPGVAERAREILQERFHGLDVAGVLSPRVETDGTCADQAEIAEMIEKTRPQLLFAAFGCPKQEKWIARHYRDLGVPVSIGVGASFDFVAGTEKRAPGWMQRISLEWLWRMLHNPRKLCKRYLVDDMPFLWHVAVEWFRRRLGSRGAKSRQ